LSYGTLNAAKSNAILICHFFAVPRTPPASIEADKVAGYWTRSSGRARRSTQQVFVVFRPIRSSTSDPATECGHHRTSLDRPGDGQAYGMTFPIVTIRDFVEVQKKLADKLGITKFALVAGASMGALQTYEWATAYPDMVAKIMPVIAFAEADANLIAWLDIWATPIRLDPKWNGGDYYGREPPNAGLAQSLKIVTLHAQHWKWANATFGRKWAKEGEDPATVSTSASRSRPRSSSRGRARAATSDANHFLSRQGQSAVPAGGGRRRR
jgi:homoserine O-acetyltransferase